MPILQATGPLVEEGQNPALTVQGVGTSNHNPAPVDPREAERAEAANQDEASLVMAGLVYDKECNPEAPGNLPYWEEIISYNNVDRAPADVDFDDMVSDRPTLFSRVAITSKTKPRASVVPESTYVPPPTTGSTFPTTTHPPTNIPLAKIPSMLKRLAREPSTGG
ncbi:hypothetical protein LIER_09988 [Lithospermum erythrorhizon]|uniref:Uncharacterized protein n=1 Tax=Lithospermum erythrorhizon TaxID=34254 RepID=A0AAV3PLK9_LITER